MPDPCNTEGVSDRSKRNSRRGGLVNRSLIVLVFLPFLFMACQPASPISFTLTGTPMTPPVGTSTPTESVSPLPALQVITTANAGKFRLLRTLPIPGFTSGGRSQCSVAFSLDGKLLGGACYQNTIPLWDVQSGLLMRSLESSPDQTVAVAFSPVGEQVAAGGFGQNIQLWDSATGQLIRTIGPLPSPIWELAFVPDGDRLASANFSINYSSSGDDPGIHLWNILTGELLWDYRGENEQLRVLSVDYSPDGKTIAFGTFNSVVILDAETGELAKSLPIPDHVGDLAFSPDGKILATASDDHKIRLWETGDYELVSTLDGHTQYVNGVAFSPSGRLVVSGSHDRTVGIWDVETGQMLNKLEGHEAEVLRVSINSSGTLIASISWDGTVRLWGVPQ
jgi:WD40 repeat protein